MDTDADREMMEFARRLGSSSDEEGDLTQFGVSFLSDEEGSGPEMEPTQATGVVLGDELEGSEAEMEPTQDGGSVSQLGDEASEDDSDSR